MDLMVEPVIVAAGHTYEQVAMLEWFEKGNKTDPMTRAKLPNRVLIPNYQLKKQICLPHTTMMDDMPLH